MLFTIGGFVVIDFSGSNGLKLPKPVGVSVGVPPTAVSDAKSVGGNDFGISKLRNFKFINLHAMLNSSMFILPSESVSARDLKNTQNLDYLHATIDPHTRYVQRGISISPFDALRLLCS